jgi:penicillin-binding protein 1A
MSVGAIAVERKLQQLRKTRIIIKRLFKALRLRRRHPAKDPVKKRGKLPKVNIVRISLLSLSAILLASSLLLYVWLREIGVFNINASSFNVITALKPLDNSIVYDSRNEKIGELFNQYRVYIPYEAIPPQMIQAITSIEDRNFFQHPGYDLKGILRAVVARLRGLSTKQGASTITQQVVRHFLLTNERSLERKVKEVALAIALESKLSKKKIFEIYVNNSFLGNGAYGIGAAAQRYFGKSINELNLSEITLIAGLFQSPSKYNPIKSPVAARKRQQQVINAMVQNKALTARKAILVRGMPLHFANYKPINDSIAPYFIDYIAEQAETILKRNVIKNQGIRIYTTLDSRLQKIASSAFDSMQDVFRRADRAIIDPDRKKKKSEDSAVEASILVTDPVTGHILAVVGGRDYGKSQFNRAFHALRQPGSAFKPAPFSLALDNGYKWSDLLYISPISIDDYRPQNYQESYGTETTMLRAFYKSINTAAVEIANKIGFKKVIARARDLGVLTPLKDEAGVVLGSSEVTMLDMATMYGTFAAQGVRRDPVAITRIEDREGKILYQAPPPDKRSKRVLSEETAFLMVKGMRAVFDHGTAYASRMISPHVAGKTGTSNNAKDNWFCGFSPNIVTIVWVGTDSRYGFTGSATGASLALPIWEHVMSKALKIMPPPSFKKPETIVTELVDPIYGNLDNRGIPMYFREGQQPVATSSDLKVISHSNSYRSLFD